MNKKRLCEIVDKYKYRLVEGTLVDERFGEPHYCIMGACLHEAGIDAALRVHNGNGGNRIWDAFQEELIALGFYSAEEVTELISVNDETQYRDEYGTEVVPTHERLHDFLACE